MPWRGLLLALGLTAVAAAIRAALDPVAPGVVPFATFYVSTVLVALLAGAWAGALATAAALVTAWYFFLDPPGSFALTPSGTANLVLFVLTQAAVVVLAAVLRAALHRAVAAEAALQDKIAELEALMDLAPVGIWFARGPEVREVTRNRFAAELMRAPESSTAPLGRPDRGAVALAGVELRQRGQRIPPEDMPLQRALRGIESRNEEYDFVFADGSSITMLSNARAVRDGTGQILGAVSASLDVTALKRTEAALREAIAQRELLHREADHRIKNSLQLVAGVLRLQRGRVQDEAAAALLDEAVARVGAVAEAHAALQRSPDLSTADAGVMVEELCGFVGRLNPEVAVRCTRSGDTMLDVERAMPLGLVVIELLTNALRHGFPEGQAGEVEVRVAEAADHAIEITVRDEGVGMEEGAGRPGSLGRDLVRTLSGRIGADLSTRSEPGVGTCVLLRIPRPDGVQRPQPAAAAPQPA
jgi:two-component sensor histidine kinase